MVSTDELIIAAQNGNQEAFEEIMHRYAKLLHSLARRYYLPNGELDDLVQEADYRLISSSTDISRKI